MGYSSEEAATLREGGKALLASLSDEQLDAELERRERDRLLSIGLSARRNQKPPRPKTELTDRIRERKEKERELKAVMDERKSEWEVARGEVVKLERQHPPADGSAILAARDRMAAAKFDFDRAESDWRRCRSGRHALQLAEDRWIADQEYTQSLRKRGFR